MNLGTKPVNSKVLFCLSYSFKMALAEKKNFAIPLMLLAIAI